MEVNNKTERRVRFLSDHQCPGLDAAAFRHVLDIPGGYVNDHCLIHDGQAWHLFFIQGEVAPAGEVWSRRGNEIHIGHATSRDLRSWDLHEPALTAVEAHPLQAGHIYAPYVIEHDGVYHMFYAGTPVHSLDWCRRNGHDPESCPPGIVGERMFLATSPDLWQWTPHPKQPILVSNPEYAALVEEGCYGCRDAHVIRHPEHGFVMYYVAALKQVVKHGNCWLNAIAAATSDNLVDWTDRGPVLIRKNPCFEENPYARPESPCVVERNGLWYLFWKGGNGTRYVISDEPLDFQHHEAYFLATSHASEIFEWQGRWYITSCSRPVEDVEHKQDRTRGLYLAGMEWDGIWPRLRQTGVGAVLGGTSRMKVRAAADGELVTRDYRPTDDQRIAEIVKLAWLEVTLWKKLEDTYGQRGGKPWWRYKLDPVLARGKESPRQLVVAEWNGEVVGYATYVIDPDTRIGQVLDNAVDPACGGKGIGSAMHRQVLRRMREDGMVLAKVGTGLDENQAAARRLYEKHGFKEIYREVIYVRRLDNLVF